MFANRLFLDVSILVNRNSNIFHLDKRHNAYHFHPVCFKCLETDMFVGGLKIM